MQPGLHILSVILISIATEKQKVYVILANSVLFVNSKLVNTHSPKRKANSVQILSNMYSYYIQNRTESGLF